MTQELNHAGELDDHKPEDKGMQDDVPDTGGEDPEMMVLGENATQADFDAAWNEGDTITADGRLA